MKKVQIPLLQRGGISGLEGVHHKGKDNATSKNKNEENNAEMISCLIEGGMEGRRKGGMGRREGRKKGERGWWVSENVQYSKIIKGN